MTLFSWKMLLIKISNVRIPCKLPQITTIAEMKKEITNAIDNRLLLMQLDLRKNLLVPKVNQGDTKRGYTFPA
jgi:hypothetical protein